MATGKFGWNNLPPLHGYRDTDTRSLLHVDACACVYAHVCISICVHINVCMLMYVRVCLCVHTFVWAVKGKRQNPGLAP